MNPDESKELQDLLAISGNMHNMSMDELRAAQQKLMALLPPETQEVFRQQEAMAKAAPPRPRLTEITAASLEALSGEDLDFAVIDYIDTQLSAVADYREGMRLLPRTLQVFYLSFIVESEVMNGGFKQFFWNPSGILAEMVAPALRELQASGAADIFEKAQVVATAEGAMVEREDESLEAFSQSYENTGLNQFDKAFARLADGFPALRAGLIRNYVQGDRHGNEAH